MYKHTKGSYNCRYVKSKKNQFVNDTNEAKAHENIWYTVRNNTEQDPNYSKRNPLRFFLKQPSDGDDLTAVGKLFQNFTAEKQVVFLP